MVLPNNPTDFYTNLNISNTYVIYKMSHVGQQKTQEEETEKRTDSRAGQSNTWIIYCIFQPMGSVRALVSDVSSK